MAKPNVAQLAFRFVLLVGIVNLFADFTYEGARSIAGPFLGSLGASAAVVGLSAGAGELAGYGLRSVSGYFADRTHRYWLFVLTGYAVNMLAAPALALAGNWPVAVALVVAERTGRAIRKPSMDAMLSHAGKSIGRGWVFGLNGALDQTGATVGPLVAALVLRLHGGYHRAFAGLLIPALLCLFTLAIARALYPRPQELEERSAKLPGVEGVTKAYWLYMAAGALAAAGFADFSLMAFHFQQARTVADDVIPVFYAVAMSMGGLSSLVLGKLFDRLGARRVPSALAPAFILPALSAPLVFFGGASAALAGVVLWGIGMGVQDSLLKAVLAGVIPAQRRSTAFGVYDTAFGIAWFFGSAIMGVLHDQSLVALAAFSVLLQLAALPAFYFASRAES